VVIGPSPSPALFPDLFASIFSPVDISVPGAIDGVAAGSQNDPLNADQEAARLLTHVIFSPIQKTADRTLQITYTLTIAVARTA
jgi:hypothetical protein